MRLANAVSVTDSDYRGQLKVKLSADGTGALVVKHGDRISMDVLLDA